MGKLTFILGGAGSGKSAFAVRMAKGIGRRNVFVATAEADDAEMKVKIAHHRKERPLHWITFEAGGTPFRIPWPKRSAHCLIVDSLTLWVSSLIMDGEGLPLMKKLLCGFERRARAMYTHTLLVSDEVGCGIVPESALGRKFRESLGCLNQKAAELADEVFLVSCGLPIQIKGGKKSNGQ